MRVVVIGASSAGGSLCEAVRALDPHAEITLISAEPLPLASRCLLPLYLSGERTKAGLQFRAAAWPDELCLRVIEAQAVRIDPTSRSIDLSTGEAVSYDRLGVAAGASPCAIPVPGIGARGVFSLYTLPVAQAIKRRLPGVREVAVLGAGLIGLKAAVALRGLGKQVTVIEQRPTVLPDTLDPRAATIVAKLLERHGIRVLTQDTLTEVLSGPDHTIAAIRLASGGTLPCEMLIQAVGTRPNVDLLRAAGAAVRHGVVVDRHLQTSLPGVYAAGDVAEAPRFGAEGTLPQANWLNAKWEGRLAAHNLLGRPAPYPGRLRANAVRLFDVPLVSVGQVSSGAGDAEILEASSQGFYRRLVFEDGRLTGLILVGDTAEAGALTALIRQGRDVTAIRSRLARDGAACLPAIAVGFWQKQHQQAHSGEQAV